MPYRNGGSKSGRFFVSLKPFTSEPFCLIPGLYDVSPILDDNSILVVLALKVRFSAALVVLNVERGVSYTRIRLNVNAVLLSIRSLRRYSSLEGSTEFCPNSHVFLSTNHIQCSYLCRPHLYFFSPGGRRLRHPFSRC